jgi:arylsulfatase A-like enzyme
MRYTKLLCRSILSVWGAAILGISSGALAADGTIAAPASRPPNILVILADDMGYGELGCQGNPQIPTPNIDSIARNGIRFTSGYVSAPVCSPSRAGIMTGRYGTRFGYELNPGFSHSAGLPLNERTIAEYLKAAGYATGMFGKWHLGFKPAMQPLGRGFDEYFGFLGAAHSYLEAAGDHDAANSIIRGREKVPEIDYTTDAFGREAVAFIEKHHDHPWFVYLPFNAVHGPLAATPKYMNRFANIPDLKRRTYCAVESALDDAVGAVLAKVREHHLEENTLIIYLSDNGAPKHSETVASNLPLRGYKAQLLEGGIREPFMIQWKGRVPAGKLDDRPVISLDILPTALAAVGAPIPAAAKLDGVNLLPYLTGEITGDPHATLCWRYANQSAVRMGDWKLIEMGSKTQLYNITADIGEKNNLADAQPQKVKELQAAYQQWDACNGKKGRSRKAPDDQDDPEASIGDTSRPQENSRSAGVVIDNELDAESMTEDADTAMPPDQSPFPYGRRK